MRRLWITRRKASAARHAKMNVYIEDPENGDVEIDGTYCRKLGELKNDQQKRFTIGTEAAKICVIADKLSKDLSGEFVEIPEGEDDVFLTGRNCMGSGNPFRFDDDAEEDVPENRKKSGRKALVILAVAVILGILAGVAGGMALTRPAAEEETPVIAERRFTCEELQITLSNTFTETEAAGYDACYSSGETAVFLMREDFSDREDFEELTVADYGAMVLAANGTDQSVTLEEENGLTTFDMILTDSLTGETFLYYCGLYKGQDAFWMVQITTLAEGASDDLSTFHQWLESVTISA